MRPAGVLVCDTPRPDQWAIPAPRRGTPRRHRLTIEIQPSLVLLIVAREESVESTARVSASQVDIGQRSNHARPVNGHRSTRVIVDRCIVVGRVS